MEKLYYDNKNLNQFVYDLKDAYTVEHYEGRHFWTGPAVRCDFIWEISKAVKPGVKLQQDSMGKRIIVYPCSKGKQITEEEYLSKSELHPDTDWENDYDDDDEFEEYYDPDDDCLEEDDDCLEEDDDVYLAETD